MAEEAGAVCSERRGSFFVAARAEVIRDPVELYASVQAAAVVLSYLAVIADVSQRGAVVVFRRRRRCDVNVRRRLTKINDGRLQPATRPE